MSCPGFPNLKGGVVFVGVDGNSRYQYNWDTNNIAPRLGASYQLNDKTVVRAGYSHIFGPSNQGAQGTVGPFGFRTENLWVTSIDGITPLNTLQNPYPNGFVPSPGSSQGLLTQAGANLQARAAGHAVAVDDSVQRQRPARAAVGDVRRGRVRRHARLRLVEVRRGRPEPEPARPAAHVARIAAQSAGAEPVLRHRQQRRADAADRGRGQLLRPYPQFTDVIPLYAAGAKSRYNALQITGRKRMSHGLMFEGSYTLAKTEEIGMNHQNSYDIEASWALTSYDIDHRFVISYLYELPFGRNRRFGSDASTLVNAFIGGWQFNGITTLQTGTPLSITANNTAGIFGARTQPNNNGNDPRLEGPVVDHLTAPSTPPSTVSRRPSRSATSRSSRRCCARTACSNFDLSLFKNFELSSESSRSSASRRSTPSTASSSPRRTPASRRRLSA